MLSESSAVLHTTTPPRSEWIQAYVQRPQVAIFLRRSCRISPDDQRPSRSVCCRPRLSSSRKGPSRQAHGDSRTCVSLWCTCLLVIECHRDVELPGGRSQISGDETTVQPPVERVRTWDETLMVSLKKSLQLVALRSGFMSKR